MNDDSLTDGSQQRWLEHAEKISQALPAEYRGAFLAMARICIAINTEEAAIQACIAQQAEKWGKLPVIKELQPAHLTPFIQPATDDPEIWAMAKRYIAKCKAQIPPSKYARFVLAALACVGGDNFPRVRALIDRVARQYGGAEPPLS